MAPIAIINDLDQSHRLFESVVVHANDAILITEAEPLDSPGPRIVYANPAFTRMTGYSLEEVLGRSPRLLQGPLSGSEAPALIRAALQAWKPIEIELINYRKDGEPFWVQLSITPVASESGWYTHWISVQREITERKEREETAARLRVIALQNEALSTEIADRKLIQAEMTRVAFHDGLTGLRNRVYFMDSLRTTLIQSHAGGRYRACVLYIDLDDFKGINDTLGHRVGDLLLIEIAQRIKRWVRDHDILARLGGDEFTVLMGDVEDTKQMHAIAQHLLHAIREPVILAGTKLRVTASIGLCAIEERSLVAEDVLRDADLAMYAAKRRGGGQCVVYDERMHAAALADLQIKLELAKALEQEEFEVFYQPFVDTKHGTIGGMEALIRWNHPTRGLLAPHEFIPIAEGTGLIVELGMWVLRQACKDSLVMQQNSQWKLCLSVNVSSRQLEEPHFVLCLSALLSETGMDANALMLEITESVFLKDAGSVGEIFKDIRSLGVKIAFDDFGTGYSSLNYLRKFPIDTLKIDQAFVREMGHDPVTASIVETIIKLAQTLGMSVSAEGIETEEEVHVLRSYGCNRVQGYLYSGPIRLQEILEMLPKPDPFHSTARSTD
ncbi:sensor domain-containing protein [Granulicella arctica]|uniref:sensor domain-containing protein n=1 Tax=Granulicella arctica TaxID=940613 RepID=UPI0021E03B76|nr:EAL domain-containing protein [Granulicella arctica]